MALNGTYLFKTVEQLVASGWVIDCDGDYWYRGVQSYPEVVKLMLDSFSGRKISVVNGIHQRGGWNITPEMVLSDEEIIDRVLTKYADEV
jgi:hypothetical protein